MLTLCDIVGVHSPGGLGRHDQCEPELLLIFILRRMAQDLPRPHRLAW